MDEELVTQYWERMREGVGLAYNQTSLTALGLCTLLVLGSAVLLLPRRHAILPVLLLACFIPVGQRIVLFTLDFTFLRIIVLFGWARILLRREGLGFTWKPIDKIVVLWALAAAGSYIVFHNGATSAIIFKLGGTFDVLGMYFLFRILIRSFDDTYRVARAFILISFPVAIIFFIEYATGRNLFSVMGGVPEITRMREGRLRCQGAFVHPIAAGCFWASAIPLMAILWWHRGKNLVKERFLAGAGIFASLMIVLFCSSSTPVAAVMAGCFAACFFPLRRFMKLIILGSCAMLLSLHMVMKAPVWQLIARVDFVGGSTAYHRYQLIDQAINRMNEWWLMGCASTAHWGHFLFDVANTYIYQAVRGGLITLVLFLLIIVAAYKGVGMLWRVIEKDRQRLFLAWALGVCLFTHCASFIALNYSNQTLMMWFLSLAIVGSLSPIRRRRVYRAWT
ncbi:MAG: hypothetical protein ACYTG7_12545 [Planctomycetota bacterium]|jgi:hypothetical protein